MRSLFWHYTLGTPTLYGDRRYTGQKKERRQRRETVYSSADEGDGQTGHRGERDSLPGSDGKGGAPRGGGSGTVSGKGERLLRQAALSSRSLLRSGQQRRRRRSRRTLSGGKRAGDEGLSGGKPGKDDGGHPPDGGAPCAGRACAGGLADGGAKGLVRLRGSDPGRPSGRRPEG